MLLSGIGYQEFTAGPAFQRVSGASEIPDSVHLLKLARPERFELPTSWFVVADSNYSYLYFNKLDSPPSSNLPLKAVKDV